MSRPEFIEPLRQRPNWYRIPEIPYHKYVGALKPIYTILERENKSVSDPDIFMRQILKSYTGMSEEEWYQAERQRLYDKALSMKMGDFHEELLGKFPGYVTLKVGDPSGCDVSNTERSVFIEVKNKENTMNADSASAVIQKLTKITSEGHRGILVLVNVSKKTVPRFGAPRSIEVVSGRQMYTELSGRDTFFDDLQRTLSATFDRFKTYSSLRETI